MTVRDDLAADLAGAIFDLETGMVQMVIYTQPAREPGTVEVATEIPAQISYGENPGGGGRQQAAMMTALIPRASIAEPRQDGDTITVDGVLWRVRQNLGGDMLGATWKLECTREERAVMRGHQ